MAHLIDYLDRPAYISPDATLGFAIDELVSLRASCLLALDEDGKITGIITLRDVLRKIAGANKVGRPYVCAHRSARHAYVLA